MARCAMVIGTLALASTAGCKRTSEVALHRLELPGMAIDAPTYVKAPAQAAYRSGELRYAKYPVVFSIAWQLGEPLTAEEMPQAIKLTFDELMRGKPTTIGKPRAVKVGGHDAIQLEASISGMKVIFTDVICGRRSAMIALAGDRLVAKRDHILQSFECKPDAREEAALENAMLVGSDDPTVFTGWRLADAERSPLTITNDELVVVFAEIGKPQGIGLDKIRNMLPGMFGIGGGTFTPTGSREQRTIAGGERRIFERGTLTVEGESLPAVSSLWSCSVNDARAMMALAMMEDESSVPAAIEFLSKIRCAQPGDPPLPIGPYVPEDAVTDEPTPTE